LFFVGELDEAAVLDAGGLGVEKYEGGFHAVHYIIFGDRQIKSPLKHEASRGTVGRQ
jgi:hypothetical protein